MTTFRCFAFGGALAAAIVLAPVTSHAQFERTISTTFDGWNKLPDGTYELVFGYMNRNPSEVAVPLGVANKIDPAPEDHGQPTVFLPGRQRLMFKIPVPAGFKGKYVWTLTYGGVTQTATASLDQNYSLDVGDEEAPAITLPASLTVKMSEAAQLKPTVSAKTVERRDVNSDGGGARNRASAPTITVWWSKYRGPGTVTFGDGTTGNRPEQRNSRSFPLGALALTCSNPPTAACGQTTARFSLPGTYMLRAVAAERTFSSATMTVTVTQ